MLLQGFLGMETLPSAKRPFGLEKRQWKDLKERSVEFYMDMMKKDERNLSLSLSPRGKRTPGHLREVSGHKTRVVRTECCQVTDNPVRFSRQGGGICSVQWLEVPSSCSQITVTPSWGFQDKR